MCITFFYSCPKGKGSFRFFMAFNREEQTQRETLKFDQFHEDSNIYGGRDVQSGGTWLGINIQTGLLVFLTNYYASPSQLRQGISRGKVVSHFLMTSLIPKGLISQADDIIRKQLHHFSTNRHQYAPFNLTVCNLRTGNMHYMCSQWKQTQVITLQFEKVYALSNSDIKTRWQKTKHGVLNFQSVIDRAQSFKQQDILVELAEMMQDTFIHKDLPDEFSTIFVQPHWSEYAKAERRTKSTTLILMTQIIDKKEVTIKQITYGIQQTEQVLLKLILHDPS